MPSRLSRIESAIDRAVGMISAEDFRKMKKSSKEKDYIEQVIKSLNLEMIREYKFVPERRFKSDWYLPKLNLLLEYEGLMSRKSRHTTVTGFSNDAIKYNYATTLGFRLLRYTAMNYKNIGDDLRKLLKKAA